MLFSHKRTIEHSDYACFFRAYMAPVMGWSCFARRYNGPRSRKTKGSLADKLQCNIWRRAQTPHWMTRERDEAAVSARAKTRRLHRPHHLYLGGGCLSSLRETTAPSLRRRSGDEKVQEGAV